MNGVNLLVRLCKANLSRKVITQVYILQLQTKYGVIKTYEEVNLAKSTEAYKIYNLSLKSLWKI